MASKRHLCAYEIYRPLFSTWCATAAYQVCLYDAPHTSTKTAVKILEQALY
jgi:hypothetical protein